MKQGKLQFKMGKIKLSNKIYILDFYAPGLKGPPGASSVWIVCLSVCLSVRLSVIPSRLHSKNNI